jgi:hypothetical protein
LKRGRVTFSIFYADILVFLSYSDEFITKDAKYDKEYFIETPNEVFGELAKGNLSNFVLFDKKHISVFSVV